MKPLVYLVLASSGLVAVCLGRSGSDRWPIREQETIQKTLTVSGEPMRVTVDNLEGYVHVAGITGSNVRVTAHKTIRAENDNDLRQAKSEVSLQMTTKPGSASIYYDAPWRCNGGGCGDRKERRFYDVTYDIDVEVPRAAKSVVSTVNEGDVRVTQLDGDFDIGNINGGIRMNGIAGSGDVHTINGPIEVHFVKNPHGATGFKSINGPIDVYFRPDLAADLLFKTFNGEIYSDFEVSPRPIPVSAAERRDGKFVYRSNGRKGARVGSGGPELSFDAFNGNIRLHKEQGRGTN